MEKYDLMSDKAQSFINPAEINRTLAYAKKYGNDASMVRFILDLSLIHISEPTRPY